jgi:hypothetical protein
LEEVIKDRVTSPDADGVVEAAERREFPFGAGIRST